MKYDAEQQRKNAVELLQAKRTKILDDLNAGKYRQVEIEYNDDNTIAFFTKISIAQFHSYCDNWRLIGELVGPVPIISVQFTHTTAAARCFVYLEWLIGQLKAGKDPRAVLIEVMNNG